MTRRTIFVKKVAGNQNHVAVEFLSQIKYLFECSKRIIS
jgi:hypothetical protein